MRGRGFFTLLWMKQTLGYLLVVSHYHDNDDRIIAVQEPAILNTINLNYI